jgi:type VI protein secretion system component VasF
MVELGTTRMQSRGLRGGATSGLRQRLSAGRRIVHVLDAFVKSALKDNGPLLANWNVVKRVQRTTGRAAPITPFFAWYVVLLFVGFISWT